MSATEPEWSKPAAMAIPADGYFELQRGRYGPVFPRTPACYGFSIIAKGQARPRAFTWQWPGDAGRTEQAGTPADENLLAAKLMGRRRSGAPLVLTPEHDDP